jgi:hypothetical protein
VPSDREGPEIATVGRALSQLADGDEEAARTTLLAALDP